ncbi:MAG: S41 family peptidase [Candidatus Adlerbacteria bacterium]|nr:S41 family peptidase [Candidatus Adlerbacteria bacterium]
MTSSKWKAAAVLVAIVGAFYVGVSMHQQSVSAAGGITTNVVSSTSQPTDVDMKQFWTAYQLLNSNFVMVHASSTFPTQQEQIYGAIAGLTASFNDPYTVFFPPSDATVFQQDISGSFGGVGMEIDNNASGQLVVVSALKNTPAERAGIQSGDIIVAIGATSTANIPSDQAVKIIRGPIGTTVTLKIQRVGEAKPLSVSIVRDTINIPVLDTHKRDDGIFVINLYSFSENSVDLFLAALRQFIQSGDTKLILDLRGNPGGYLDAAVNMASYFLPVGDTVVTEDFKGKQDNVDHRSLGYNIFQGNSNFKMAVLVNQGSASASEILAGALQQHGVAKLVGTRSFGKGSVQELMDLGGGAELKVTIARWLTPNGSSISDGGLQPDIQAARTLDDVKAGNDPQTNAAVLYLLNN